MSSPALYATYCEAAIVYETARGGKCLVGDIVMSGARTAIAAPLSTYDGRTKTGYPTRSQKSKAAYRREGESQSKCRIHNYTCIPDQQTCESVSEAHSGWSMPYSSHIAEKRLRSSALSIMSGLVPKMLILAASMPIASVLGI